MVGRRLSFSGMRTSKMRFSRQRRSDESKSKDGIRKLRLRMWFIQFSLVVNCRMGKMIQQSVEDTSGSLSQGTADGEQRVPELQRARGAWGKFYGKRNQEFGIKPLFWPLSLFPGS